MRILYFTRGYTSHDRRFLDALCALRHEVGLLTLTTAGERIRLAGMPPGSVALGTLGFQAAPPASALAGARFPELRAIVGRFRPDVIHAGPLTDCAYLSTAIAGTAVVACSWAFDVLFEIRGDPIAESLARQSLRHCAGLLVDCKTVFDACRRLADREFPHCAILPWGITPPPRVCAPMNLRSRAGWPGDAAVVFSTRSFERVSDVPTLISAFAIARSRRPNLRLALAGDGSQRRALEDQAAAAGLGGAVRFLGQLADDEVFSCFCESDIYASCALCDGTSVSLLEAMSAGIMPLVTDIPSNREWITPPTNGWLASPGAPGVFAAAMIEAADVTPERRAGIRAQNRRQVAERADWNANRAKLDALYRAVCAENPSSPAL